MTTRLVAVDGRDAVAYVLIRPGKDERHVTIEASAHGLSKDAAASILRRIADQWTAQPEEAPAADS